MRSNFLESGDLQKEEFKTHIFENIDRQTVDYTSLLENILGGYFRNRKDIERVGRSGNIPFFGTDYNRDEVITQALFNLLQEPLKAEICRIIDKSEWPTNTVPLPDEREKEMISLDQKIMALNKEIDQLDREAEEAGINIQEGTMIDGIVYPKNIPAADDNQPQEHTIPAAESCTIDISNQSGMSVTIPAQANIKNQLTEKIISSFRDRTQNKDGRINIR